MVDHLIEELRHSDVTIRLKTRIDDLSALQGEFDEVIIATGAVPQPLGKWPGNVPVLAWSDVLRDGAPAPTGAGHAVFVDEGTGFWFSYGVAEILVVAGWKVTFVTSSGMIGAHLPVESVPPMLGRLGAGGTTFHVLTGLEAIGDGGVVLTNLTSGEETLLDCDLVVLQTGRVVAPAPVRTTSSMPVHLIGDCVTPRRITHALFDGQKLARTI
jgi:2,4-dienoyl-CoA reductase (NADPH2)